MLPLPELHRDRQPGLRTGNGYLPYGLSSQMGLVRQRQGLPYQSLHTAPGPAATAVAPGPAATSAVPSQAATSAVTGPAATSATRSPAAPSQAATSSAPSQAVTSAAPGPSAKATPHRKRGRFCTAGFCKRATGPYLCRSRRP